VLHFIFTFFVLLKLIKKVKKVTIKNETLFDDNYYTLLDASKVTTLGIWRFKDFKEIKTCVSVDDHSWQLSTNLISYHTEEQAASG